MNYTDEAIDLLKKFSSGVSCPEWDKIPIQSRMFHPKCEKIAEEMGKREIDRGVARKYILEKHNPITVRSGRLKNSPVKDIKNCMVVPKRKWFKFVAIHGTAEVCSITKEEAKFLKKEIEKLLKGLQS